MKKTNLIRFILPIMLAFSSCTSPNLTTLPQTTDNPETDTGQRGSSKEKFTFKKNDMLSCGLPNTIDQTYSGVDAVGSDFTGTFQPYPLGAFPGFPNRSRRVVINGVTGAFTFTYFHKAVASPYNTYKFEFASQFNPALTSTPAGAPFVIEPKDCLQALITRDNTGTIVANDYSYPTANPVNGRLTGKVFQTDSNGVGTLTFQFDNIVTDKAKNNACTNQYTGPDFRITSWVAKVHYTCNAPDISVTVTPNEVRPLRDKQTSRESANNIQVNVKVSRNNIPLQGVSLTLKTIGEDNSGGHIHTGVNAIVTRPKGKFISSGTDQATATTNTTGEVTLTYKTSGYGGSEQISASLTNNLETHSEATVNITVPNLVRIPDPASGSHYILVGETPNHPENHFVSLQNANALLGLANDFSLFYPTSPIAFNDTSLENGGPFEIDGQWGLLRAHLNHREGNSTDTPIQYGSRRDRFNALCLKHKLSIFVESDHWHLTKK